jgi:hypothetical protein
MRERDKGVKNKRQVLVSQENITKTGKNER